MQNPSIDPDRIAKECLDQYNRLGKGGAKPTIRNDGKYEWTILAGVVLAIKDRYVCIALTTGVKALPLQRISQNGDLLHDSHAEVLARRSVRHWLLERLLHEQRQQGVKEDDDLLDSIPYIFIRNENEKDTDQPPFRLKDTVSFHLYCSTLPCGDISSSLIVQNRVDDTTISTNNDTYQKQNPTILRGRTFSSSHQIHIRTKPGRPDSEPSISMSCSDKIVCWILMGFQGTLLFDLIGKVYFSSFTIADQAIRTSMQQGKSLEDQEMLMGKILEQTRFMFEEKCKTKNNVPTIHFTSLTFLHSKESVQDELISRNPNARISGPSDEQDLVACATSLAWIVNNKPHGIVEGHRQGASLRRANGEPLKKSSRSKLCKLDWFYAMMKAKEELFLESTNGLFTYHDFKAGQLKNRIHQYRKAKRQLRGTDEMKDEDRIKFEHCQINSFLQDHNQSSELPSTLMEDNKSWSVQTYAPLYGWMVSGSKSEQFDVQGHPCVSSKE